MDCEELLGNAIERYKKEGGNGEPSLAASGITESTIEVRNKEGILLATYETRQNSNEKQLAEASASARILEAIAIYEERGGTGKASTTTSSITEHGVEIRDSEGILLYCYQQKDKISALAR